ncbi:LamG domain-containing protein [Mariniflexile sp. AS56]|uniref:LamG domain-containing protein n=1 Tax=Mariniflexile sp. AS56 TaxID=3063957 RepID=UPI0026EC61B5|nr:LamG domain-containing protein [Mariniflexile sp. AS56]MDO7171061.1 LamG domain-containing protein [Mariniflexile sp. AS56]
MNKILLLKVLLVFACMYTNSSYSQDSDGDGIVNAIDVDDDNDGILDSDEGDEDDDDDDDGIPNLLDLDSDNDGCYDSIESGGVDANNDGRLDGTGFDLSGRVTGGSGGYNGLTGNEYVATKLTVSSTPSNKTTIIGDATSFQVSASARNTTEFDEGDPDYSDKKSSSSNSNIRYQWYVGNPSSGGTALTNSGVYSGTTSSTLNISDVTGLNGNDYCVVVTHTNNKCILETYCATLTVNNPCDPVYSGDPDFDNDGVTDICDLDDDNDGVIDTYECSAVIQFNNAAPLTAGSLSNVQPGEKVIYSNAIFYQNQYYDLVLTIITKSGSFTVDCNNELRVSTFNASQDDHVTYSFDLVKAGSATPANPDGVPTVLYDMILELRDIDTRNGSNFTEIAGFNASTATSTVAPYLSPTTNLEQAGFVNGGSPAGYTLYRLDPTIAGPTNDWVDEPDDGGTQGDDPDFYLYMEFDQFSHVDLLYGATGTTTSTSIRLTNFGISSVCDSDRDGFLNTLDIDSDNDGIPDNVEAQPTIGYVPPVGTVNPITGIFDAYGIGLIPVDTDGDNLIDMYDFDTDNDGIPDVEENGMANLIVTYSDADNDGLDDLFEGSNINDPNDINDEIDDPTSSILPDVDADLFAGGDLDYRDYFDGNPPPIATIDFDGVDDYMSRDSFISGLNDVTIMAWVKSDSGNTIDMVIAGEGIACQLSLEDGNRPTFKIKTVGNSVQLAGGCSCSAINYDEWHHIAGSFSSATGILKLYVDGELANTYDTGVTGAAIEGSSDTNNTFEIGRFSNELTHGNYFKGDIDEVRVFGNALTEDQIQRMVYQEIENNGGNVKGKMVAKDVVDIASGSTVSWTQLLAYYPMTEIKTSSILDYSNFGNTIRLHNITTIQEQTAPMPYTTTANGAWTTQSTWLHGEVWDIENIANNKDWSIVKIASDVTACHPVKTMGLIIDANKTFTVHTDNHVENSWYLELNGTLNLQGDSQLLQTTTSDLVTSATGKVLRRQEGTSSPFRYNYWSSPVGAIGATSLTNNNAITNNTNNSAFKLNTIKDEVGINMPFTSSYNQAVKISTYWLYTFKNGKTYWDWASLNPNSPLTPGVGYTQKGTGNAGLEQQYIFEGKPNNGTVLVDVIDKGGPGSVTSVSKTQYLLGNPYPSALDVHKFIDDNVGVIDGTLQLWQQWSGNSHNLSEYEGGYAQVNKLGSCRAYQFVGFYGGTNGSLDGTVTPSRYLPVGQGFITEIIADGTVVFNNDQRIFVKESDADGSYNNGSSFLKSTNTKSKSTTAESSKQASSEMTTIRLEFNSVEGPKTRRELLLGFSEITTDGYDYGYDAYTNETNNNDLNLNLDGKNLNMQAYSPITIDKVVSLNFKSSGSNTFEIKATEFDNLDATQAVYLRDNTTGDYFDLTNSTGYVFTSNQGKFNERFEMVFKSQEQTLSAEEASVSENFIYYQNTTNTLYGKKLSNSIDKLAIVNMRGQTVLEFNNLSQEDLSNGLKLSNVATGAYIAWFKVQSGQVITKKILVN